MATDRTLLTENLDMDDVDGVKGANSLLNTVIQKYQAAEDVQNTLNDGYYTSEEVDDQISASSATQQTSLNNEYSKPNLLSNSDFLIPASNDGEIAGGWGVLHGSYGIKNSSQSLSTEYTDNTRYNVFEATTDTSSNPAEIFLELSQTITNNYSFTPDELYELFCSANAIPSMSGGWISVNFYHPKIIQSDGSYPINIATGGFKNIYTFTEDDVGNVVNIGKKLTNLLNDDGSGLAYDASKYGIKFILRLYVPNTTANDTFFSYKINNLQLTASSVATKYSPENYNVDRLKSTPQLFLNGPPQDAIVDMPLKRSNFSKALNGEVTYSNAVPMYILNENGELELKDVDEMPLTGDGYTSVYPYKNYLVGSDDLSGAAYGGANTQKDLDTGVMFSSFNSTGITSISTAEAYLDNSVTNSDFVNNTYMSYSVFVKAGFTNFAYLGFYNEDDEATGIDGLHSFAVFDLNLGTIVTVNNIDNEDLNIKADIVPCADGFYRCSITRKYVDELDNKVNTRLKVVDYNYDTESLTQSIGINSSGTPNIYACCNQLSLTSSPMPYISTQGLTAPVSAGASRFYFPAMYNINPYKRGFAIQLMVNGINTQVDAYLADNTKGCNLWELTNGANYFYGPAENSLNLSNTLKFKCNGSQVSINISSIQRESYVITCVYGIQAGKISLFLDGDEVSTANVSASPNYLQVDSSTVFNLGSGYNATTWQGNAGMKFSNLKIFNRPLDAWEVNLNYNSLLGEIDYINSRITSQSAGDLVRLPFPDVDGDGDEVVN